VKVPGKLTLAASILGGVHVAALAAGFLAPYGPTEQ